MKKRVIMFLSFLIILAIIGCGNTANNEKKKKEVEEKQKETYLHPSWWKPFDASFLDWGDYKNSDAEKLLNSGRITDIWTFNFIALFYKLRNEPLDVDEVKFFFSKYKDESLNEFERKRMKAEIEKEINEYKNKFLNDTAIYLVSTNIILGDYDFDKKGFPILDSEDVEKEKLESGEYYHSSFFKTSYGIDDTFYIPDYSTTILKVLDEVNEYASLYNKYYKHLSCYIEFLNANDKNLFPDYIYMNEQDAESLVNELYIGKNCKVAKAYIVFKPIEAVYKDDMAMGVGYKAKKIKSKIEYLIIFTKNNKVFAVFPAETPDKI